MSRILVLGSINMDVVVTAPRHPQLGETIFGDDLHFIPGGKGSNQAVAASRLGGNTHLIGRLGEDAFGTSLQDFLRSEQLNLEFLATIPDAPTGTALITVNHDSENTIIVVSGANKALQLEDVREIELQPNDVVVSQFEVPQPVIRALFMKARAVNAHTILNPAPAEPFIADLRSLITHLVVNETELAFFSGRPVTDNIDQLTADAQALADGDQTVIVTLGQRGLLCVQGNQRIRLEGQKVEAVDTTGAGDCFVGALAVGLSEGVSLAAALQFANKAAALSVQRLGASSSMPYRQELA